MDCWCLVRAQRFGSGCLLFPSLYPCLGSIVQAEAVIDIAYPTCFYPRCYLLSRVGYPYWLVSVFDENSWSGTKSY